MTDIEAAAENAKLTGQVRSFLDWLGDGRKLTQTGRIGLADARYLVEFLGTGDRIDPVIGDRVFKTKSSEELASLTTIVEWAKAARLVRTAGTKLVPVKKNAALADKPFDLVLALLDAYPKLGKTLFPRNAWRHSMVGDEFDDISQELLTALITSAGPCPVEVLSQLARDLIDARYVFDGITERQADTLRRVITVDVRIAMSALHVLGVVVLGRGPDDDLAGGAAELTDLGRHAIRRLRGLAEPGDPVLQVLITLADVADPPVWRRVIIPAAYSLDRVHRVVQAAMGWEDCHLHRFRIGTVSYGPADLWDGADHADEARYRLADLPEAAERIDYEYDFGDSWEHELVIEARLAADDSMVYPACVAGEGACPPEDCGGSPGFAEFKELLAGPPGAEREEMLNWAGGDYDPIRFDLRAVNAAVAAG